MKWRRFSLKSIIGREMGTRESFKDNPYLENLANRYLGSVGMCNKRNSKFLVMIDPYDMVEDESNSSNGSSSSRNSCFGFELPKMGAQLSLEFQPDQFPRHSFNRGLQK